MVYPLGEWLDRQDAYKAKDEALSLRAENQVLRRILRHLYESGRVPPTLTAEVQRVLDLSA